MEVGLPRDMSDVITHIIGLVDIGTLVVEVLNYSNVPSLRRSVKGS